MESGAWEREYERWKNTSVKIGANIYTEVQYVTNWYINNLAYANNFIEVWSDDPTIITASTVTRIYNHILGIDTTFYDYLDLNKDGVINSSDATMVYNILLGR